MDNSLLIRRSRTINSNKNYLCFTALTAGSTVALTKVGEPDPIDVYISYDKRNWVSYTIGSFLTLPNIGDKVYFWNKNNLFSSITSTAYPHYEFKMTGSIAASGNVNSLINFRGLSDYCFYDLFNNCTSLITAPELPATSLAEHCYYEMFSGCTALSSAPALPATTLKSGCYESMFMFCDSIITAPILSATTLAENCYKAMFYMCFSLTGLIVFFDDWSNNKYTSQWVDCCTNTSDFVFTCPLELDTSTTGVNRVLSNWTINKI